MKTYFVYASLCRRLWNSLSYKETTHLLHTDVQKHVHTYVHVCAHTHVEQTFTFTHTHRPETPKYAVLNSESEHQNQIDIMCGSLYLGWLGWWGRGGVTPVIMILLCGVCRVSWLFVCIHDVWAPTWLMCTPPPPPPMAIACRLLWNWLDHFRQDMWLHTMHSALHTPSNVSLTHPL